MKRLKLDLHILPAQMILSFMALVLLTAAAAGLPAIWLIRDQLERQAWAQVEQGSRAAEAFYAARQSEIKSLATLTAQRPALRELLAREERATLATYLRTLQTGTGLDLMLVCDLEHRPVAQGGEAISDALCLPGTHPDFHVVSEGSASRVWLLAASLIRNETTGPLGTVVVGLALDEKFTAQMRAQTGLEHTLLVDGQPVSTSLMGSVTSRKLARSTALVARCEALLTSMAGPIISPKSLWANRAWKPRWLWRWQTSLLRNDVWPGSLSAASWP